MRHNRRRRGGGRVPQSPASAGEDLHDNGVVFTVEYGERTFLFTGDAEAGAEARMVETRGDALASDVYQAGHHDSATSRATGSSRQWVRESP